MLIIFSSYGAVLNLLSYYNVNVNSRQKLIRTKKGGKRIICEKDETFIYVPILESLQQLLSNNRIASMVLEKPKPCRPGVLDDIQDGDIYQNDEYFDEHENILVLVLYHDELEVSNLIH